MESSVKEYGVFWREGAFWSIFSGSGILGEGKEGQGLFFDLSYCIGLAIFVFEASKKAGDHKRCGMCICGCWVAGYGKKRTALDAFSGGEYNTKLFFFWIAISRACSLLRLGGLFRKFAKIFTR